ncbi:hypothetical protein F5Y17DRAFT_420865 [Xylariaceae sp. FL0594]|nr:hypothetical protein F5Y17DRAFT_420865 [Xylariaceae sp. FL0594]
MAPALMGSKDQATAPTEDDSDAARTVQSYMYYLERTDLYDVEKPYTMRYEPDEEEGIPQTNFVKVKKPLVVRSMRHCAPCSPTVLSSDDAVEDKSSLFKLEECGFQKIVLKSQLSYDEFWDNDKVTKTYVQEVKSALKRELGAKYVFVLDYAVRRRHPSFPVSTGGEYEYDQPTSLAHIDFTIEEGERIINVLFGDRASEVLTGRWQAINVWKPIKGPLNDWPLGLCDTRSVDWNTDVVPSDVVFDDFVTENIQIYHNPAMQWYYLPDQESWEALIFKSADSVGPRSTACPHSGFYNPSASKEERRESLDCRCFVFYADLDEYPPIVGDVCKPHAQML